MEHGLSTELRYLIYSALLMLVIWIPYVLAELRQTGPVTALSYPEPRKRPAWAERLAAAHYNLVENMVPFAIAVGAGEVLNVHTATTAACAAAFFWARLLHPVAQVSRVWGTRSLTFGIGAGATLVYLVTLLAGAGG